MFKGKKPWGRGTAELWYRGTPLQRTAEPRECGFAVLRILFFSITVSRLCRFFFA